MPLPALAAPLIAAAGGALSRVFFSKAGAWLAAALVFLGIELATGSAIIEPLRDKAAIAWAGIPAEIAAWMGVLQLDRYATIILAAYVAAFVKQALLRRRTSA